LQGLPYLFHSQPRSAVAAPYQSRRDLVGHRPSAVSARFSDV